MSASAAAPWLLASYLLGAIPTSYLAARVFRGIDLREHGSRNLGATNLYRVLGWRFAVPVGLFDMPPRARSRSWCSLPRISASQLVALLCGVVAIVGHVFSVFVRFRGGKGVATAAGVMLALAPASLVVAALVWAVLVKLTGYVSLGSIAAAAVFPVAVYLLRAARPAGDPLGGRAGRGGDHLAPSRQHQAPAPRAPRTGSAGARLRPRTRDPHRGAGRGQLGHHPGQPAGGQGRRRPALGLRAGGGGGDQPDAREPAVPRGRRLAPALRATGDAGEAVRGAEVVVSAPPSHAVRAVVDAARRRSCGTARWWSAPPRASRPSRWRSCRRCSPRRCPQAASRCCRGPASRRRCPRGSPPRWWPPPLRRPRRVQAQAVRHAALPGVLQPRRHGRRAGRGAQERDRDRGGDSRRPRPRAQSAGRAHHPRPGRDHPARRRAGRRPAHLRRPRRHGRPGPHDDGEPEPEPVARRGAGRRAERFEDYRAATAPWPKGANTSRGGARWPRRLGSSCRSPRRSAQCCFEDKPPRRCGGRAHGPAHSRRSNGDDDHRVRCRSSTRSARSAR